MTHAHCYDCGLKYGSDGWIEAIIPDKVWNAIKPDECDDGCGLLCITCIARRLKIKDINNVPVWLCGTENLIAREGDPSDRIEELRELEPNQALEMDGQKDDNQEIQTDALSEDADREMIGDDCFFLSDIGNK